MESDYIDFEAPEVHEEALPFVNAQKTLGNKQRILLKYPDGSLGQGKAEKMRARTLVAEK